MTTNNNNDALEKLHEELVKHDWFYMYSDDSNSYEAGRKNSNMLSQMAKEAGPKGELLFFAHHFTSCSAIHRFEVNPKQIELLRNALDEIEASKK